MSPNNWVRLVPARGKPQLRFVCFPHAGGSAIFSRPWASHRPDDAAPLSAASASPTELPTVGDESLHEDSVSAWSAFTRAEFSPRSMPGGHDIPRLSRELKGPKNHIRTGSYLPIPCHQITLWRRI